LLVAEAQFLGHLSLSFLCVRPISWVLGNRAANTQVALAKKRPTNWIGLQLNSDHLIVTRIVNPQCQDRLLP
jgi:hypothetical protein